MSHEDNPMAAELDAQEQNRHQQRDSDKVDLGPFYEELTEAPKNETVGFATSEVMHAFYRELQRDSDIEVSPAEGFRNHLENLAHRHEGVFERAMRKLEIDREA